MAANSKYFGRNHELRSTVAFDDIEDSRFVSTNEISGDMPRFPLFVNTVTAWHDVALGRPGLDRPTDQQRRNHCGARWALLPGED